MGSTPWTLPPIPWEGSGTGSLDSALDSPIFVTAGFGATNRRPESEIDAQIRLSVPGMPRGLRGPDVHVGIR